MAAGCSSSPLVVQPAGADRYNPSVEEEAQLSGKVIKHPVENREYLFARSGLGLADSISEVHTLCNLALLGLMLTDVLAGIMSLATAHAIYRKCISLRDKFIIDKGHRDVVIGLRVIKHSTLKHHFYLLQ